MTSATAKRYALTAVATLSLTLTGHRASAAPTEADAPYKTMVVRYDDLNLTNPKDARRLYARIRRAARVVCDNPPMSERIRLAKYEQCLDQAVADAVARINSRQLTIIHEAEARQP
jgi:UrcA family protein